MTNSRQLSLRALFATIVAILFASSLSAFSQVENTIYAFTNGIDSGGPWSLISDGHGNFFGTTVSGTGTVFELSPTTGGGWTLTTIYTFPNGNPANPRSLVMDHSGNLFGVSENGGTKDLGTIFKLAPDGSGGWTHSTLYEFHGSDGEGPTGSLALDSAGNLYGTTINGGKCSSSATGCGVAFELSPQSGGSWTETVLHNFGSSSQDGQTPFGGLARDAQGNLFGTTSVGGKPGCSTTTCGTIFELTQVAGKWSEKILHYFNSTDGAFSYATPVLDASGNIYGTTYMGGANDAGTVFKLARSSAGWQIQVVHSFNSFASGEFPVSGVTLDSAGNIYAATQDGGPSGSPCKTGNGVAGCGSVWQFAPSGSGQWTSKLLHVFSGGSDGRMLNQRVIVSKGGIFGTATYGGVDGFGTIFEITPQ